PAEYCIAGTCKTENIGIERVIVNVVSNPSIRFLILAGPEVPGHLTGKSMRALYNYGVDPETRKIVDAPGAIPYIENIPLESVERFRRQVEFVDMLNNVLVDEIASTVEELSRRNPGVYPEEAIWVQLKMARTTASTRSFGNAISLLPEYDIVLEPSTSFVRAQECHAIIAKLPTGIGIEIRIADSGTTLTGKEF
ncbi:MAG: hypothetical protein ACFFAY_11640, partial [Promethearchaeota archaeon]